MFSTCKVPNNIFFIKEKNLILLKIIFSFVRQIFFRIFVE